MEVSLDLTSLKTLQQDGDTCHTARKTMKLLR
ncbi:unnamed protein product [Acanthoscelides obtectus]|uniref:Uncharacterized protein n=1 Tax=Acanthoscelides obtectus TaxID=200917 RepID=A0A9P0NUS8_ACAOB|nr:unnamed protein product [Acanthoscelides obtectus]CAK1661468.1 hypothetical protein AOBTE_LOCUS22641 [Acanthoscelides obtectus]